MENDLSLDLLRDFSHYSSRMTQFLRDQISDSEEVVTPLMLDGTYLSRNFATLGTPQLPGFSFFFSWISLFFVMLYLIVVKNP